MKIDLTDDELKEEIRIKSAEIEALTHELRNLENEAFYRKNPECRPKN